MRHLWLLPLIVATGCTSGIQHATMAPDVLDFGVIDIEDEKVEQVTFSNLEDADVYLYFLAPSTFEADMVPAGDDQGTPFNLDDEMLLTPLQELSIDIRYGCWAQDRGFFRWEITVLSSLDDRGYWEATRDVGELTLKGTCGSED
jgi:hypothetical protein